MFNRIGRAAVLCGVLTAGVGTGVVLAHESRQVGEYTLVVGFVDEPVYNGQESGLDLRVSRGEEPVEGLEETLEAEVTFEGETRVLPISALFGEPGAYRSVFFPTAAGQYTFRISGTIEGKTIDESFTSGPETFGDVQDVAGGQFPVILPPISDVAREADAGAAAATTATVALVLGAAGLIAGLLGLGLALARRRT